MARFTNSVVSAVVALAVAASACGSGQESPDIPLSDQIVEFNASSSYTEATFASALETTPLTVFVIDGVEDPYPVSDLFVVGTVLEVSGGKGYSWSGEPQIVGQPSNQRLHDFNDSEADISTVRLSVRVVHSLYRDKAFEGLKEITVGLALLSPVDLESLKSEVTGKTIVAPLYSNEGHVYSYYEPGVFEVFRGGESLGYVDADNEVTFPAAHTVDPYPEGAASIKLEDLLDPPRTVHLTKIDGRLIRSNE